MNNRIRELTESKTGASLVILFILAALTAAAGFALLGVTELSYLLIGLGLVGIVTLIVFAIRRHASLRRMRSALEAYVESITRDSENAKNNTLMNFPMPIAVFHMEDTRIVWANEAFFTACGEQGQHLDARISDLLPNFSTQWLAGEKHQYPELLTLQERKYRVHGNIIRGEKQKEVPLMGITYWIDVTDYDDIRIEYEQSRPVTGIIVIDNYEELIRNQTDREKNRMRDALEDKFLEWAKKYKGFVRRYERDRYLVVFEKRNLEAMKKEKFPIVEEIHSVSSAGGITSTISLGFGEDADDFSESLQFADMALELALTRGGDQTVIKNKLSFEFFGGRGSEIEKRTKVKSRVMATAIEQLMRDSTRVYTMGHRFGDLDSIGAAIGICALARQKEVPCQVVVDEKNCNAVQLIQEVRRLPEYETAFVSAQEALSHADSRTLLVIVDTNRPEQLDAPELLNACSRVAVIDHHRISATYIHNAALGFLEPSASSACELVTEILQEVADVKKILPGEAEALLSGIVLDTKNFTLHTGDRTFDAGAFLRRAGADPTAVKKLLQCDLPDTIAKYKVLQNTEIYKGIAVSVVPEPTGRVIAAKAADEMLNISGVDASLVLFPSEKGGFLISARSIGDVKMQILMEKLGGGGSRSAAASQLNTASIEEAKEQLLHAIDDYFGE